MTVEEQLRDYRTTLDIATEAAASRANHTVAMRRIRPVRSLAVAAVAVAAAVAIAFTAIGVSHHDSTRPAGVDTSTTPTSAASPITAGPALVPDVLGLKSADATTVMNQAGFVVKTVAVACTDHPPGSVTAQDSAPGSRAHAGATLTLTVCSGPPVPVNTVLPVVSCRTEFGNPPAAGDHAPASVTVVSPPFTSPALSGYSDSAGYLPTTAPVGWGCRALVAADGSEEIDVTPPGVPVGTTCCTGGKLTRPPSDGVFADSTGCVGCVFVETCAIVPGVGTTPDFVGQGPCPKPPDGELGTPLGDNVFRVDDPPGVLGPDAARSVLKYTPPGASGGPLVTREACVLPASQAGVCDALLDQFLALNPSAG